MKQNGQCIIGDPVRVDKFTSKWLSVRLHPCVFYRRLDIFRESFKAVKGLYTEIDTGENVLIRFSDKEDLTAFYRVHHQYV